MEYTPSRILELVQAVPWRSNGRIRLFWLCHPHGSRDDLAAELSARMDTEAVVPLILRAAAFNNANAVLSDAVALFEANRALLEAVADGGPERLTVLVLAKEDFRLINASSPITLPDWFPICPATQTFFSIEDLGQTAEVKPLNCSETRLDHVAELLFDLERSIVQKLQDVHVAAPNRARDFIRALLMGGANGGDVQANLDIFVNHLNSIGEVRAYRPNAAEKSKFLAARILKLVLNSSPKQLAVVAEEFGKSFVGSDAYALKPTFSAIMWRPANKTPVGTTNWHAILIAFFQCYQLMNAKAHADEFPAYAVTLQYSTSLNLRRFLASAKNFVSTLN